MDYIKRYMGAPTGIDVEALRQENENARRAASRVDSFSPLPCVPASAAAAARPWLTAALSRTSFSTPALSRPRVRALSTPPPAQLRKEREDLRSTIDELNARLTEDKGDDA